MFAAYDAVSPINPYSGQALAADAKQKKKNIGWKYYVYELIDPRDGSVFYVGKGSGERIHEHEKDARNGFVSKNCHKIRKIHSLGLAIGKRMVASFKNEADAYLFENDLIKEYGKAKLCNVAPLMDGDEKQSHNVCLSDAFMRVMAIGFRHQCGERIDYSNRQWAAALSAAFARRFPEFRRMALERVGFEALRDGVRKYGVDLLSKNHQPAF